jgi:hypothetical protein
MLAGGHFEAAGSRKAGITTNRIWQWFREQPAFKARIRELRVAATNRAVGVLAGAMTDAVMQLRRICTTSESEHARIKAADALLTHAAQMTLIAELQDRVSELEADRGRVR